MDTVVMKPVYHFGPIGGGIDQASVVFAACISSRNITLFLIKEFLLNSSL